MEATGIQVLLCTQQPFVALGLASALGAADGFELAGCCDSLAAVTDRLRPTKPDILLIHLSSRISLAELSQLRTVSAGCRMVLWGDAIASEFAFQAMHLGVHGILPCTTSTEGLLTAMRSVHRGVLCFERELVETVLSQQRVTLTRREGEIVSLVAQGLKNKAIAGTLGITEGTVKVYLYKLFKKLGMNDRLELALYGLKNLFGGQAEPVRAPEAAAAPFGPRTLPPQPRPRALWQRAN